MTTVPRKMTTALWLAALLLLQCSIHTAQAIDAECSACEAVAAELQRRLDAEVPRTHLDMRHRLDKDGNRYGKVINYKVSEQRAVDLLDDLCTHMDDYTLIQQDSNNPNSSSSRTEAATATALEGSGASEAPSSNSSTEQELVWVKRKGEGSTHVSASQRPSKAEEELRVKQLTTFCGMILERYEDEVLQSLTTDEFMTHGVAPVMCQNISKKCQGMSTTVTAGTDNLASTKQEL